ncbi:MAG: peptidylprolyl isomerase, partial [Clostridia bacterium]|nr:peptidylprolyl isomerase [Clostridia bacterium]
MLKFSKMASIICILALLGMALLSGCGGNQNNGSGVMGKDVAATVNGVAISMTDLDNYLEQIKQQYAAWGLDLTDEQWEELKGDYLDDLIEIELLKQDMEKAGLSVDVEAQYQDYVKQYGGEEALQKALKESGYTKESFLIDLEKSLVYEEMYAQATKEVAEPSEEEIAAYYAENQDSYKEYQTRHVLFLTSSEEENDTRPEAEITADAKAKAQSVISRLDQGEDIAEISKELSEDSGTAQNGGYFAFGPNDAVDQAYMDAALALTAGQYTQEPVLSQYGYHVIKLEAVVEKSLEDVRE